MKVQLQKIIRRDINVIQEKKNEGTRHIMENAKLYFLRTRNYNFILTRSYVSIFSKVVPTCFKHVELSWQAVVYLVCAFGK